MVNSSWFKRDLSDPVLIGFANIVSSIIAAVFWLIVASIITTDVYGELNYYLAIAGLGSTVSIMGLNHTNITYIAKGNEKILTQANFLVLIISSSSAMIVAELLNHIPTAILLLGMSAFVMATSELLGRKEYRHYSTLVISSRIAQVTSAIGLYFVIGINGIVLGYAVPLLALSYPFFTSLIRSSFSFKEIRPRLSFSLHSYSMAISQAVAASADKLLVAPIFGFAILGLYQLGFQFLMFLSVIPGSLYAYLLPQEANNLRRATVKKFAVLLSILLALGFYALIPHIIIQYFPKYSEGIVAAQIMVFGVIPLTFTAIFNAKLLGSERSRFVMIASSVYASATLILMYLLSSFLGLIGMAISILISLSIQSFFLWLSSMKAFVDKSNAKRI